MQFCANPPTSALGNATAVPPVGKDKGVSKISFSGGATLKMSTSSSVTSRQSYSIAESLTVAGEFSSMDGTELAVVGAKLAVTAKLTIGGEIKKSTSTTSERAYTDASTVSFTVGDADPGDQVWTFCFSFCGRLGGGVCSHSFVAVCRQRLYRPGLWHADLCHHRRLVEVTMFDITSNLQ